MTPAVRTAVMLMAVTCASSFAVSAQDTDESAAASKVLALENAWNLASETRDLKALNDLLDEAFVYVDVDGRVLTKGQVLKDVKESGVQQVVTLSMVARPHGQTVIVTGLFQMKATRHGKPYVQQGRFIDTWLNKNGRWVALASLVTPTG